MKPDLSIIIVCHKGWARLIKCLESIEKATRGKSIEVIITDNNSADGEILKIRDMFKDFKFILSSINGGFGYGCNMGARAASGEYLLFINPDTAINDMALTDLYHYAVKHPDFTLLSCKQVTANGRESNAVGDFPRFRNLTGLMRSLSGNKNQLEVTEEVIFPDWVSGSVMLISSKDFFQLGGFDEDYWMYFEDVDLCKRIRIISGKIAFNRNITIEHNHGGSSRVNLRTTSLTKTEVMISRHVYFSKHSDGGERFFVETFMVVNNLLTCGLMACVGLLLFFNRRMFSRFLIFCKLVDYYFSAAVHHTWISKRSVNYPRAL